MSVYMSGPASGTRKHVHWELIGWLWFAIGGSHVSDRRPRPLMPVNKRWDEQQERGDIILIKDYKAHTFKKRTMCADN